MESVDDIRNYTSIGLGIINNGSYDRGYIMINIWWIQFELMITEKFKVYKRSKYGNNGWSEWVQF